MKDELQAIEEINNERGIIEAEKILFKSKIKPHEEKLYTLIDKYSRSFSPLKIGDEIEYTPSGTSHAGIVRVKKANCLEVPDKWEYQVVVVSVGNSREKKCRWSPVVD